MTSWMVEILSTYDEKRTDDDDDDDDDDYDDVIFFTLFLFCVINTSTHAVYLSEQYFEVSDIFRVRLCVKQIDS